MGINLLCPSHELLNYVFFQLYFSAVNNRDNVRLHRTEDEFLRFISYVSDDSGGSVYIFWLFLRSFSCPFGIQHLQFNPAHNRTGKRRGFKLKVFKVSHIFRFSEERDSSSYHDFILILNFVYSFSLFSVYSIIRWCLWAELLLSDSKQSVWERASSHSLLELLRPYILICQFLGLNKGQR